MGDKALKAFIKPEERHRSVTDPLPGPFNRDCTALHWTLRGFGKTIYKSEFIPANRISDFLEGEQEKEGCIFFVQKTSQTKSKKKAANAGLEQVSGVA